MADLLECLLQIKGLRETADRVARLVPRARTGAAESGGSHAAGEGSAAGLLARLAESEWLHGAWLRLMLAEDRPVLTGFDPSALTRLAAKTEWNETEALERFLARRRDNLELLGRCTAEDLARVGLHSTRRVLTVADLVAVMLAADMERIGEIAALL